MTARITFYFSRLRERLWFRPLLFCILSIIGILLAKALDYAHIENAVPNIEKDSIEKLLTIISTSMLVIATFSVASMVAAYSSATKTATPRCFSLVISDDRSQNAFSAFVGSFIFSIVAFIVLNHNFFYYPAGRFGLFILILIVLIIVIFTFVGWTDRIVRLGRLSTVIEKVETAASEAFQRRKRSPTLRAFPSKSDTQKEQKGQPVYPNAVGYIHRIEVSLLQTYAEKMKIRIIVSALPGVFAAPGNPLAYIIEDAGDRDDLEEIDRERITDSFLIGDERLFDEDPRFGLVVLSEIGSRALSPAVNDPGTAIDILNRFVRLFVLWDNPLDEDELVEPDCERIEVPEIDLDEMFDDAFHAIARDGANNIEVSVILQKSLIALTSMKNPVMEKAAKRQSQKALARAELALQLPEDKEIIRKLANSIS